MGVGSHLYNTLLLLHLLAVVIGFGSVFLNGIHGAQASRRKGEGGLAISESVFAVSKVANYFIYAVPLFGMALLYVSERVFWFDQLWISLSWLFYFAALGLAHGLLRPNVKKMNVLQAELLAAPAGGPGAAAAGPPPQVAELERRGKTVAMVSGVLNLLVVVLIALMVWKPGI